MRPNATFDSTVRPRKQSNDQVTVSSGPPTTFFLASEADLARRASSTPILVPDASPLRTLKQTLEEADHETRTSLGRPSTQVRRDGSRRRSTIKPKSTEELRPEAIRQHTTLYQPSSGMHTPSIPTSQEPSLPSSPKSLSSRSFAKSDDELTQDDYSSQAIESEGEDEGERCTNRTAESAASLQDSAPQLIMPSIRMPSRRPFTDRGKRLGKFKIMVVGSQGCGKTSLIKSIVQLCEDIVHVDPLTSSILTKPKIHSRSTVNSFNETYASTRPYPSWWSDTEESRILRRRKSMGDSVLERNICFVDTAHAKPPSFAAYYIEQQLRRTIQCVNQTSGELASLLSGHGGSHVDVVLYLISHATFKDDLQHIHQLSDIVNVVPLIAKSDLLTPDQIAEICTSTDADSCSIPRLPMTFGSQMTKSTCMAPYSISCVNGPDFDTMDASLLMSSEYIQPLLPSELHLLVDEIFQPETVAYLRHTAAKKLTAWYNSTSRVTDNTSMRTPSPTSACMRSPMPSTLNSPLQASLSISGVLVPITSQSDFSLNTSNSFALARVADHTQKEERLAHIRLSKWASDLQLSLQREREKYEDIARSERAVWLVERMGEEIREGQLVPVTDAELANTGRRGKKARLYSDGGGMYQYQLHDPLGLLRWQDAVRAQTWLALQVVGSFGVVGGLALFVTKTWGIETSFHQWAREWGVWQD